MKSLWRWIVALGFRLLYNELAWLYDPVSWVASLGRWHEWQRAAFSFLPARGKVLEVGFGPGHLLADLADACYQPVGLDLSRAMLRQASRTLRARALVVPLCQGHASALPFAAQVFDAIVAAFPTRFIYAPEWMHEVKRVLCPGGWLVVVEQASFRRGDPVSHSLEWLYGLTGQRDPTPDLAGRLGQVGLAARRETANMNGTDIGLVIARKESPIRFAA